MIWNYDNDQSKKSIIVLQGVNTHFIFDVYIYYIEWDVERIIWIAFYKNNENNQCFVHQLPKDLIKHVLKFLGKISVPNNPRGNNYNNQAHRPFVKI